MWDICFAKIKHSQFAEVYGWGVSKSGKAYSAVSVLGRKMSDLDSRLWFFDMQWMKKATPSHLGIAEMKILYSSSFLPRGGLCLSYCPDLHYSDSCQTTISVVSIWVMKYYLDTLSCRSIFCKICQVSK